MVYLANEPTDPGSPDIISATQLGAIMPRCPEQMRSIYAIGLSDCMLAAGIDTVTRAAAFVAQLAHESNELRWFEEQGDGRQYEGRSDLGNNSPGDGPRYKGRGPIQLTGRNNYRAAGAAIGLDLEGNPDQAADVDVGLRVATWFWVTHGCNEKADACDFSGITRAINGGLNHLDRRLVYYHRALEVLGRGAVLV